MPKTQDVLLSSSASDSENLPDLGLHIQNLLAFISGDAGIGAASSQRFGAAGLASRDFKLFAFDHPKFRALGPVLVSGHNVLADKDLFEAGQGPFSPAAAAFVKAVASASGAAIAANPEFKKALDEAPAALAVDPADLLAVCESAGIRSESIHALGLGPEAEPHWLSAECRSKSYATLLPEAAAAAQAFAVELASVPSADRDAEIGRLAAASARFAERAYSQEAGCLSGPSELALTTFLRSVEASGCAPEAMALNNGTNKLLSTDARKAVCEAAFDAVTGNPASIRDPDIRDQIIRVVSNMNLIQSYPALLPPSSGSQSPELHGKPRKPR